MIMTTMMIMMMMIMTPIKPITTTTETLQKYMYFSLTEKNICNSFSFTFIRGHFECYTIYHEN